MSYKKIYPKYLGVVKASVPYSVISSYFSPRYKHLAHVTYFSYLFKIYFPNAFLLNQIHDHLNTKILNTHTIKKGEILPKTKKFGCVGDLTFLLLSKGVKQIKVWGDLSNNVENNKSFASRPSDPQKLCLSISLVCF